MTELQSGHLDNLEQVQNEHNITVRDLDNQYSNLQRRSLQDTLNNLLKINEQKDTIDTLQRKLDWIENQNLILNKKIAEMQKVVSINEIEKKDNSLHYKFSEIRLKVKNFFKKLFYL